MESEACEGWCNNGPSTEVAPEQTNSLLTLLEAGKPQIWKSGKLKCHKVYFSVHRWLLVAVWPSIVGGAKDLSPACFFLHSGILCMCLEEVLLSCYPGRSFHCWAEEVLLWPPGCTGHEPPCLACSGPFILTIIRAPPSWPSDFLMATYPIYFSPMGRGVDIQTITRGR